MVGQNVDEIEQLKKTMFDINDKNDELKVFTQIAID